MGASATTPSPRGPNITLGSMNVGIVPVKRLDRAKTRLEALLGAEGRVDLARALFEDALALADGTPLRWLFVSDDPDVLQRAADQGHETVRDRGEGLNEALVVAIAAAVELQAEGVVVVPSDVPLTRREDVLDIVDTGTTSDVVLVPARDGGTNGMYLGPPDALAPSFGEASVSVHAAAAEAAGLRCSLLPLERLALDIDSEKDVDALLAHPDALASHGGRVLQRLRARSA
jgi:2-phospho-L-lactate/phosphoenolpyruvate guanylyltransferase